VSIFEAMQAGLKSLAAIRADLVALAGKFPDVADVLQKQIDAIDAAAAQVAESAAVAGKELADIASFKFDGRIHGSDTVT